MEYNKYPVLVLNCKIGGLAIMRTLGSLGVPVYGIDGDPEAPGLKSRYCKGRLVKFFDENNPRDYLEFVLDVGRRLGEKTLLIPTSDELSVFVAEYASELDRYFVFPKNEAGLVKKIISKEGMYELAVQNGIPTPWTIFPRSMEDVLLHLEHIEFPVMLKAIHGNRLQAQKGKKMVIVRSRNELIDSYRSLEDPASPNLMIQEYIPGDDDQIFIFNGYFEEKSECLAGFTGHKLRQYPVHVGCASLGICRWNQAVADTTVQFMKKIGYKGVLDIGYRLDPRDGFYKVLDINPRVGQAFRLFLGEDGMDVVRALYLNLTGQSVPRVVPREGRRWVIEDFDLESSLDYYREGSLGLGEWIKSYRGVEESAWFDLKDPMPFLGMARRLCLRLLFLAKKRLCFGSGARISDAWRRA
jgi:D-aspartate ligase